MSDRLRPITGWHYVPAAGLVPCASSTARSPSGPSTRPSTSAIPPSRSTPPSPTSSTRSSATDTCSPRPHSRSSITHRRGDPPAARRGEPALPVARLPGSRSSSGWWSRTASCGPTARASSLVRRDRRGRGMEHRPIDIVEMGTADYDITQYQPVLYRRSRSTRCARWWAGSSPPAVTSRSTRCVHEWARPRPDGYSRVWSAGTTAMC